LLAIYRENFRVNLSDHFNPCRVYAYEDEAGLLVCSWPEGSEEPAPPVPYLEEVWTGLEYMLASHLIARGLTEEGLTVVRRCPRAPALATLRRAEPMRRDWSRHRERTESLPIR
jgi:Glycosyl-hydrolase family 116, catalytic region